MTRFKIIFLLAALVFSASAYAQVTNRRLPNNRNANGNTPNGSYNPYSDDENPDGADSLANKPPEGIIFDNESIPDSVLRSRVFNFGETVRAVKIRHLQNPTLQPTGIQSNDPITAVDQPSYASLGFLGQVHQPLIFSPCLSSFTFQHTPDPLPYYRQLNHGLRLFQTQTPFTVLGYGNSLDKDYQIHAIHTQNIRPRWNIAMLYDLVSREGLYTNSGGTSHYLDFSTNYYSLDARYQLQAALTYNRIRHEENGGVTNDVTCWEYTRESGVPVNMYSAQNQWRDIEIHIHQSYNTVRQSDIIVEHPDTTKDTTTADSAAVADTLTSKTAGKALSLPSAITTDKPANNTTLYDTIRAPKPSTFNSGVFALDLSYARHRRIFYDNQASSWFYNYSNLNATSFFDSTAHYRYVAELYWTNDAHMQHRYSNPVVLTGGIRQQYDEVRYANYWDTISPNHDAKMKEMNIIQFASARLHVGRFLLVANAEETNGPRRLGDYRIDATLSLNAGSNDFAVSALSQAQSPDMIFYHNEGVYSWDIDNYNKIKLQRLAAEYNYKAPDSTIRHARLLSLNLKLASSLLSDNVWFNDKMQPTQGDSTALLLQADFGAHLRLGWFNVRTHQMLQHSSNDNVVRLPLFASKNSIYADFNLFRNALRAQVGVDIRYHTKFYSDSWNPVLGLFYRQDEVQVGNYLIADLWLTIQVKRATIYARASHLNAPVESLAGLQPNYFSMPHYPYENFTLYWGLIWRFFD